MKGKTKKKIIFVCTGNTCRSPMAEFLFRKKIVELGLTKLEIASAGLQANEADGMNEKSAAILTEKGFDVHNFHAKRIDESMLKESLAIVCMTDAQRDILMEMRWKALREAGEEEIENNVYAFSELCGYEILDPYGRDMDCYQYVFELLSGGMSAVADKLLPEDIRKKYIPKPRAPRKPAAKTPTAKKGGKTGAKKGKNAGKTAQKNKKSGKNRKGEQL